MLSYTSKGLFQKVSQFFPMREARDMAIFIAILSVASQIAVPFYPVPLTLQTLAVFYGAFLLPPGQVFLSILSWLCIGVMGAPVFSCFSSGMGVILGPRGGYLFGILWVAPLLSFCLRYGKNATKNVLWHTAVFYVGALFILLTGFFHLQWIMEDASLAWEAGVFPFLGPELLKVFLVTRGKGYISLYRNPL